MYSNALIQTAYVFCVTTLDYTRQTTSTPVYNPLMTHPALATLLPWVLRDTFPSKAFEAIFPILQITWQPDRQGGSHDDPQEPERFKERCDNPLVHGMPKKDLSTSRVFECPQRIKLVDCSKYVLVLFSVVAVYLCLCEFESGGIINWEIPQTRPHQQQWKILFLTSFTLLTFLQLLCDLQLIRWLL